MKNQKRFQYGICIWNLPVSGPEACELAASVGLEGIELDMGKWEDGLPLTRDHLRKEYLDASRAAGIAFPTLGANTLCDHGPSKASARATVRSVMDAMVDTAEFMGISKLQVPAFIDGFITNEDEFRETADNLTYLCDRADSRSLYVGGENALSAEENLRLADAVNRPNYRFYFDTSNPYWFGGGLHAPSMIPVMSDRICEYHVKDQDGKNGEQFVRLGIGQSSFRESAGVILDTDYSGWILLENDYKQDMGMGDLAADLETLREIFG